jgi:hypothetical protein
MQISIQCMGVDNLWQADFFAEMSKKRQRRVVVNLDCGKVYRRVL